MRLQHGIARVRHTTEQLNFSIAHAFYTLNYFSLSSPLDKFSISLRHFIGHCYISSQKNTAWYIVNTQVNNQHRVRKSQSFLTVIRDSVFSSRGAPHGRYTDQANPKMNFLAKKGHFQDSSLHDLS